MVNFIFGILVTVVGILVLLAVTNKTLSFAEKLGKIKELFGI